MGRPNLYIDANVLIYAVEGDARHLQQAESILEIAAMEDGHALSSELTMAECLRGAHRTPNDPALASYRQLFSEQKRIIFVPLNRDILEMSAEVGAATRTKLADSIHLATALAHGCTKFVTNDSGIARAPPGLAILPFWDALK